ncbi:MAG: class I SAM-dependent methyltransferase [Pyrinomonadaceae bacterium]
MAQTLGNNPAFDFKGAVKAHWQREPCGSRNIATEDRRDFFNRIEQERYQLEPYIPAFARFADGRDKRVLEIGVGAGTDFINWVRHGADATGVDLTEQGVSLTQERLSLEELTAIVEVADAEELPFPDESFDIIYSYGVLHHSPDTAKAIREVHRVLKLGGTARIMIYHAHCWVGFLLWIAYCLGRFRPWKSPRWAIFHYLESPGTKAYTKDEASALFSAFSQTAIRTQLSHGDLLNLGTYQRHTGWYHKLALELYPRWALKLIGNGLGMAMLIEARK